MNKDTYDMAPHGPALKPLLDQSNTPGGFKPEGSHTEVLAQNLKNSTPHSMLFHLELNHSAVTTNAVACCHNHEAKVMPISMLMKLIHQDFYTYTDFFFQSPYQRCSFSKEIFSYPLRIRKDHYLMPNITRKILQNTERQPNISVEVQRL